MSTKVKELNYTLSPQQSEFMLSDAAFPAYGGGWGNGKTLVGCLKTYSICSNTPDSRFIVGRQNFTDLRDSTLNDFLELFGAKGPFGEYHAGEMKYVLKNGSEILFRHFSNLQSLTNLNLSGGWIDQAEEVGEDAFIFLRGRMRRQGVKKRQILATFNMEGHNWIYHYWKVTDDPAFHLIEADTYANKKHLPDDYLESLEKLPTEIFNRYVLGGWDQFEGQIFPEFDPEVHVIQPIDIPDYWPMYEGLDVGLRNPSAYIQAFEGDDGNLYVAKCWEQANLNAELVADKIFDYRCGKKPTRMVIDPSASRNEVTSSENFTRQLQENGVFPQKANNDVTAGIARVKQAFSNKRIFIFNTCKKLIDQLQTYQWEKPRTVKGVVIHNERPLKVNDHLCDAFRYLIMSRPDRNTVCKPIKKPEGPTMQSVVNEMLEKRSRNGLEHLI